MTIHSFNVSYPDFKVGDIIQPDELDVNFSDIAIRINQIIDVVNHITDGLITTNEDGTVTDSSGADIIDINAISRFTSPKLQAFLQEVIDQLESNAEFSGAHFIGSFPIPGVVGDTVYEQLVSFKTLLDDLKTELENEVTRLDGRVDETNEHLDQTDLNVANLTTRMNNAEADLATKAESDDVYTKTEIDTKLTDLRNGVDEDFYDTSEMDAKLDEKTDKTGNHEGTWQGINLDDIAEAIGADGLVISNNQPSNPTEKLMWFNPSKNEYLLYLNGQWRIQARPTQIKKVHNRVVLNADATSVTIGIPNFDANFDALDVYKNSIAIFEGYEYTLSADGLSINIATDDPWTAGTTFDFVTYIAQPVSD